MIIELLEKMPKKEKEKVLLKYNCSTIDEVITKIYAKFSNIGFLFTDTEYEVLNKLANHEKVDKVPEFLLDNYFVMKTKEGYCLPDELIFVIDFISKDELKQQRINIIISLYLEINGTITIKKLKSLINKSDVKVTIKQIINFLDENDIEYEDGMIYYKIPISYLSYQAGIYSENKVFDIHYINYLMNAQHSYTQKIREHLLTKVKKLYGERAYNFIDIIFTFSYAMYDFEEVKKYLTNDLKNIKLTKNELDKLFEILFDAHSVLPNWQLGGYSIDEYECLVSEDEYYKKIEEDYNYINSFEEIENPDNTFELMSYLEIYTYINGIIEIKDLIKLLKDNHNIKTTKNELISLAQAVGISTDGNVLCAVEDIQELSKIIPIKKLVKEHKIITGNVEEELINYVDILNKLEDILNKYVDENNMKKIINLLMYSPVDRDILKKILKKIKVNMSDKNFDEMFNNIMDITKNMRIWSLNGFTPNEIKEEK